jgi:bacteriorhodopsin
MLLVTVLQVLHTISLFGFSQVPLPYAWAWFGFGIVFWSGIAVTMWFPVMKSAQRQSSRSYGLVLVATLGLLLAQSMYPISLAMYKTNYIHLYPSLISLGLLDFVSRIGLGVYFSLNGDAFGEIQVQVSKSHKND